MAVMSGGTIPDRGLFGVHLGEGGRVGELDEEMVYESRPGQRFCGRLQLADRGDHARPGIVTPAPGEPGGAVLAGGWRGAARRAGKGAGGVLC